MNWLPPNATALMSSLSSCAEGGRQMASGGDLGGVGWGGVGVEGMRWGSGTHEAVVEAAAQATPTAEARARCARACRHGARRRRKGERRHPSAPQPIELARALLLVEVAGAHRRGPGLAEKRLLVEGGGHVTWA